jgi:hypothetical protein
MTRAATTNTAVRFQDKPCLPNTVPAFGLLPSPELRPVVG